MTKTITGGHEQEPWQMPQKWESRHKLFPYQVGFTSPPFDWDAAPSDFTRIAPSTVGVHGWMLHAPDYQHQLNQRQEKFDIAGSICTLHGE